MMHAVRRGRIKEGMISNLTGNRVFPRAECRKEGQKGGENHENETKKLNVSHKVHDRVDIYEELRKSKAGLQERGGEEKMEGKKESARQVTL